MKLGFSVSKTSLAPTIEKLFQNGYKLKNSDFPLSIDDISKNYLVQKILIDQKIDDYTSLIDMIVKLFKYKGK